jgi:hypothetical protein
MPQSLLALTAASLLLAQTASPLTPTEQRLQQLEQAERAAKAKEEQGWRTFSGYAELQLSSGLIAPGRTEICKYNWREWQLDPQTGARTTSKRCETGAPGLAWTDGRVAVNCRTLRVSNAYVGPYTFIRWELPTGADRSMVVALCDNLTSTGKGMR